MKLFGQIVRTIVNVAELPVAVAKDAVTMCGRLVDRDRYTAELAKRIKAEAEEERRG